jgi:hypothetical protein
MIRDQTKPKETFLQDSPLCDFHEKMAYDTWTSRHENEKFLGPI